MGVDATHELFSLCVHREGDASVVWLSGELDLEHAHEVAAALVHAEGSTVVVDLSELELIDSSGIAALLTARRRIRAEGRHFEIRRARGATRRVFLAGGLEDQLSD